MSEYLLFLAIGLLIAHNVAHRRLLRAAQPLRLDLAKQGNAFLSRRDVSKQARHYVTWLLDHAFSFRGTLLCALFAVPIIGIRLAVTPPEIPFKGMPPDAQAALKDISRLHRRITQANHPLLSTLVELEIVLIVVPAALIADALRGRLPARDTKETILTILESKEHFRRA